MKKKSLLKDDSFPDLNKDGEVTYADVLEGRGAFAVGGSLLSDDMPVKEPMMDNCLLYTSPSPRDCRLSRMPSSA